MIEYNKLLKVGVLIEQKKFADAEMLLNGLICEDSSNIHVLSLLAEVNLQQDQLDKANSIIENAIGLSPASPQLFYIKSRIAIQQDNLKEAEKIIQQAIVLAPNDADNFALLAHIKLGKKQFEDALVNANRALEIDAENLMALNARSTALNKLNKSEESFETIEGALREDPNNAYTHANYGWGLLEKGDHKKALDHFREALSNNPSSDFAQAGMVEALKATNPVYRIFLKYSFFMSNLTAKYQWAVVIGFFFGFKILRSVAVRNEALQPFLIPLIVILALVAFSTWVITPISNLFLRFNQYGQFLLDQKEKMSSNFVAVSFGLFLVGLILFFVLADEKMLTIASYGFAMMLPLGTMFSSAKSKYGLILYTVSLAIVGLIAIGLTFSTGVIFNLMTLVFIFGFVAFQWIANYMLIK